MKGKLADADLRVLVTALANKLNHADTTTSRSHVRILIEHLAQAWDLDPSEEWRYFSRDKSCSEGQTEVRRCAYAM